MNNEMIRSGLINVRRTCSASLSVEAALALPIAMFAVYLLLCPLKALDSERILQNKMESVSKELAVAAYIENVGESFLKKDEKEKAVKELVNGAAEGIALTSIIMDADERMMKNLRYDEATAVLSSNEGADPAMIIIKLKYELNLPLNVFDILPVEKELVVNRRAWVGSNGGRGRDKYGTEEDIEAAEGTEDEDRIVYVGKNSTRYHNDPHCHYLDNSMASADASSMEQKRNESGAKYHPCPCCNPGTTGTVYYFKSGTAYHSDPDCKAITAYAREVKLSEVEHLGPCSYCSCGD